MPVPTMISLRESDFGGLRVGEALRVNIANPPPPPGNPEAATLS